MATVERLGPAVSGFPANMAERVGDRLFVASMGLEPARLVALDLARHTVSDTVTIPTGLRTWAMTSLGSTLYVGMWGSPAGEPNLYRVDADSGRIRGHAAVPSHGEFWALAASPEGRTLYAGTRRTGLVFLVDPENGALGEVNFPAPDESQVTALIGTHPTLYAGSGRRQAGLAAIDRPSGAATSILPAELADAVGVYDLAVDAGVVVAATQGDPARLAIIDRTDPDAYTLVEPGDEAILGGLVLDGDTLFFAGIQSGTLYRVGRDGGELEEVAVPVPGAPTRRLFRTDAGLLGVAGPGLVWSYDLDRDEVAVTNLLDAGAEGGPERPQSLAVGGEGVAVGTNNAIEIHPFDGGGSRRVTVPGEPKSMTARGQGGSDGSGQGAGDGGDGAIYLAVYSNGQALRVDPGADEAVLVADWPDIQNRPRIIQRHADSGRLLVGTLSDFAGGGALVVIDEAGQDVTVHTDPLGDRQAVESLASHGDLALVGGRGDDARLAGWDPVAGQKRWEAVPVPAGGAITGLAVDAGRLFLLTAQGALVTVDPGSHRATDRRDLPLGTAGELLLVDGWLYAVGTHALVRVDPATLEHDTLVDDLAATSLFTRPLVRADAGGRLYLFTRLELARLTL